jgi:F-type H+-transporting ATPase subunit delta
MAELATLARPYANAVFAVAKQSGELDRWSRMLEFLSVAAADSKMRSLLDAPEIGEEQKARQLIDICGDELNDRAKQFVRVLAGNRRLDLVGDIAELFEDLRAEEQQMLDVRVMSAFPLSDEESEQLRTALARRFDKEIQLTSDVDRSLIGGVLIRAGDVVIDGSVRGKLAKLQEMLQRT